MVILKSPVIPGAAVEAPTRSASECIGVVVPANVSAATTGYSPPHVLVKLPSERTPATMRGDTLQVRMHVKADASIDSVAVLGASDAGFAARYRGALIGDTGNRSASPAVYQGCAVDGWTDIMVPLGS